MKIRDNYYPSRFSGCALTTVLN